MRVARGRHAGGGDGGREGGEGGTRLALQPRGRRAVEAAGRRGGGEAPVLLALLVGLARRGDATVHAREHTRQHEHHHCLGRGGAPGEVAVVVVRREVLEIEQDETWSRSR